MSGYKCWPSNESIALNEADAYKRCLDEANRMVNIEAGISERRLEGIKRLFERIRDLERCLSSLEQAASHVQLVEPCACGNDGCREAYDSYNWLQLMLEQARECLSSGEPE